MAAPSEEEMELLRELPKAVRRWLRTSDATYLMGLALWGDEAYPDFCSCGGRRLTWEAKARRIIDLLLEPYGGLTDDVDARAREED